MNKAVKRCQNGCGQDVAEEAEKGILVTRQVLVAPQFFLILWFAFGRVPRRLRGLCLKVRSFALSHQKSDFVKSKAKCILCKNPDYLELDLGSEIPASLPFI